MDRVFVVQQADQWVEVIDPFAEKLEYAGVSYPVAGATMLAPVQPLVVLGMAHNGAPGDRDLPRQAFMQVTANSGRAGRHHRGGRRSRPGEHRRRAGRRHPAHQPAPDTPSRCRPRSSATPSAMTSPPSTRSRLDEKMTQSKHGDGFTPIGPWIETDLDYGAVSMAVRVNGEDRGLGQYVSAGLEHHRAVGLSHQLSHARSGRHRAHRGARHLHPGQTRRHRVRSRSAASGP